MNPEELEDWMTARDHSAYTLAPLLGVSATTIYRWLRDGKRLSNMVRLSLGGLELEGRDQRVG